MAETLGDKIARWYREGVPIAEILRRRLEHMRARYDARVAERKQKEAARLAKMTPPARCWRIGREVFWEHPNSPIPVNFFEISEQMSDGRWTVHGTKTPADKHEAILYGDGPCRVEACYPQTGLYQFPGLGPILEADPEDFIFLVGRIRFFASREIQNGKGTTADLWRRALAGLGVIDAAVGWAGRPLVSPLGPPMTAIEAQHHANRTGDSWWFQTARVMARLQGVTLPPKEDPAAKPEPEKGPQMKPQVDIFLSLVAAASNANTGAYGQHRNPPGSGSLTPSQFTIEGKKYQVRGWYTHRNSSGPNFQLNLNSRAEEEAFKAAGVRIDLGQGDVINSADMAVYGGTLNHRINALYVDGKAYKISIRK